LTLAGNLVVNGNTQSSSRLTGAIIVAGGIGVSGNVEVGGNIEIASSIASTSTTTGALVVAGGVGIVGATYIGNNLHVRYANPSLLISGTGEADEAKLFLSTPFNNGQTNKTAIIAQGVTTWSRANLLFCLNSSEDNTNATSTDAKMCIKAITGFVGIGTTTPATMLQVNGVVTATSFNATSDYRIKQNVHSIFEDASFNVDVLRPVSFINTNLGKQDIGFIAHEVGEHYPYLVNGEKDGEQMQSLNYTGIIGILVKEIQELKRRVAELEYK